MKIYVKLFTRNPSYDIIISTARRKLRLTNIYRAAGTSAYLTAQRKGYFMKITVVGRQMTVAEDLKAMVTKKLERLDKYFWNEGEATVTFSTKRGKENLEITINAANTLFRSENDDETFQNALDKSIDAIERQIRKNKTRLAKRLRDGVFDEAVYLDPIPEDEVEDDTAEFPIRTKKFNLKPMSAEEAILQMELLGHQFFVFEDQDTESVCVVYKRKDGAYGLIVPER